MNSLLCHASPVLGALSGVLCGGVAFAQAPLYDLSGPAGSQYGHALESVGDVDGDGFDDLAVGAPYADGLQPGAGRVYVHSARTHQVLVTLLGERAGDTFGWSLAALGDVDGDGVGDLIVGAPGYEAGVGVDRGAAYVFSGASGALIEKVEGILDGDRLGHAVAGPGDVDGDGVPDYAYSLPFSDEFGDQAGYVELRSGSSHTPFRLYWGEHEGDLFGFSLDAAQDVDGDGVPDLVAGAPRLDASGLNDCGRGYVLSGAALNGVLFTKTGTTLGGQLGYSAAGLGDAGGDGVPDVAFGEPWNDLAAVAAGRAQVFSGAAPHAQLLDVQGAAGAWMGFAVDGLADVDGDGLGDLFVGAPGTDVAGMSDVGQVRVYSPVSGAQLLAWTGYVAGDEMGRAVASAGDLNADGFTDLVSGAPLNDNPGPDSGWARLILGNAPAPSSYCAAKQNSAGCLPWIGYTGCPSYGIGDNFHLHGGNVLPGMPGILIWSLTPAATPFLGGTLCLAPQIRRTPPQVSTGTGACGGAYLFHFDQALMTSEGLVPGTTVYAQYWSRDTGFPAPENVGLTNGLEFQILP